MKRTPIVLGVILVVGTIAAVAAIKSGGPTPRDPGTPPPPGEQLLTHRWSLGIDTDKTPYVKSFRLKLKR